MNKNLMFAITILLVLFVGYLFLKNHTNTSYSVIHTNEVHTPLPSFPATTNIISTPEENTTTLRTTNNKQVSSNSISCDYKIPAGPNEQGDAMINYSWINTKSSLCDSVNGVNNNLILNNENSSGTNTYNANWISLNTSYQFNLFNNLNCEGQIIESCNINQAAPTVTPNPKGFSH